MNFERAFCDELEKQALDPISGLALGGGLHVGMNALVKATHHTRLAQNIRAHNVAKGLKRGLQGKSSFSGADNAVKAWTAQELYATQPIGNQIGKSLSEQKTGRRVRALKKLR